MQDKHLYEYAVLRVVPRVEREEFINAGIVVFCKREKFLKVKYQLNLTKLECLCKELDTEQLEINFKSFEKICLGDKNGGPIAQMDVPSRFRWLTATRSSVIQTSKPHPGLSKDLEKTLERLFCELVL